MSVRNNNTLHNIVYCCSNMQHAPDLRPSCAPRGGASAHYTQERKQSEHETISNERERQREREHTGGNKVRQGEEIETSGNIPETPPLTTDWGKLEVFCYDSPTK